MVFTFYSILLKDCILSTGRFIYILQFYLNKCNILYNYLENYEGLMLKVKNTYIA